MPFYSAKPALKAPPKIKGFDFSPAEIGATRSHNRLLSLGLFFTAACNLRCRYCYIGGNRQHHDELTVAEYIRVINEAFELGAKTFWVPGAGEPLLQNGFRTIVEYVNSLGAWLVLFTNGTLMTKEVAHWLAQRNVTVICKLNSFTKGVQDYLAGRKGAFLMIQRGLENLMSSGFLDNDPPRLGVETVICRQNYKEIPAIFTWARSKDIFPYIEMMIYEGRAATNTGLHVQPVDEARLFYKLLEIDEEKFSNTWVPVPPYVAQTCDKLLYNVTVDSRGWVQPCCGVTIKVANIRNTSLREIIALPLLVKARNIHKHLKGNCMSCRVQACNYGCRSEAFANGDFFGSYKRCWHTPNGGGVVTKRFQKSF